MTRDERAQVGSGPSIGAPALRGGGSIGAPALRGGGSIGAPALRGGAASLFLPLHARGSAWLACAALFLYYVASMARDLSLYDSGELALAAVQLGLGHPPGQPLHTCLGFALAHLPWVPPLVGVGLASALPGALTLIPATSFAQSLLGERVSLPVARGLPWLLAVIAVHPMLWEPATRVEVYALTTFFALWAVARLAALAPAAGRAASAREPSASVFQAALALGLSASANPLIAACTGVAVAPGILARIAQRRLPARALGWAVLGGVIGLLPYAYVPLVASRDDAMIWGAPRDPRSLWAYLSLRDYAHNHELGAAVWLEHMGAWLLFALERGLLPLLALGLLGSFTLRGPLGRVAVPALLFLLVSKVAFNVVWNLDVPDYNGYVAVALWACAAAACAFVVHAHALGRARAAHVLAAVLALASVVVAPSVLARTRHRDRVARVLAERVLQEAPPRAVVIAFADHFAGSLFYLQEAERRRPDVVVLAWGLASSSWHWERIQRLHADLATFALRGEGGKPGRVRRFLQANAARPVRVERYGIAEQLGLAVCEGGLYLRAGAACRQSAEFDIGVAALLAGQLRSVERGSPAADGALAATSFELGESLWRAGAPRAAYAVLLAGVPPEMQPHDVVVHGDFERVPPLGHAWPAWRRGAALGDPARNLLVASALAYAAGREQDALALARAAADDGLPEALEMLHARR